MNKIKAKQTKKKGIQSKCEAEQNIRLKFKFKSTFQAGGKFMLRYFYIPFFLCTPL